MTGGGRHTPAPAGDLSRRTAVLALAAVLTGGFLLRCAAALRYFCSTFDTATVGLMAVNILRRGERPLFFYGQNYFGSLEAYAAAALFALFGISEFVLSLSPILFSLGWIAATYLLFAEWGGRRAGIAAALCVAAPGIVTLRYCVGSDGGYPAMFFLGTLALWLCLRIERREPEGRALLAHTLPLGAAAGLALWTHALSAAYLLPGAILVFKFLVRRRFRMAALGPCLAAIPFFLAGAAPLLFVSGLGGASGGGWSLAPATLKAHAAGLFRRPFGQHLFNLSTSWTVHHLVRAGLVATAVAFALRFRETRGAAGRFRLLYPLIFCVLFLAMYIPHPMARVMAPRYVIPFWTVLLGGLVAAPVSSATRGLRRAGWLAAAAWALFSVWTDLSIIAAAAPKRASRIADRQWAVTAARAAGLQSVGMVGSSVFGHMGQVYSFTAHGDVAFVNLYDERHHPSDELAARDDDGGLMFELYSRGLMRRALGDLGAVWEESRGKLHMIFHDIRVTPLGGRAVPLAAMRLDAPPADGAPDAVTDRLRETTIAGRYGDGSSLTLRFDRERTVNGIVMVGYDVRSHGLPRRFRILGSADGETFVELRDALDRFTVVYSAGSRVFVNGYVAHTECRFEPRTLRALRIEPVMGQRSNQSEWRISELFVFEDRGPGPTIDEGEVDRIAARLAGEGVRFVAADPWLSPKLADRLSSSDGSPVVFPRMNPRYPETLIDRHVAPGPGVAFAIAAPFADDAEAVFQTACPGAVWERMETGYYSLFVFRTAAPPPNNGRTVEWFGSFALHDSTLPLQPVEEPPPAQADPTAGM